ncbi:MAG: glycosyltransferase [Solirubrobacteraceae bacterium]
MRVLCVGSRYPPWSIGGYETTWAGAVRALRDRGHEVRVLTTGPDPTDRLTAAPAPADDVHRDLRWYWRAHEFPPGGLRACVALERANADVFAAHRAAFDPDVVMWWAMGGLSLSLLEQARRAGVPALAVVGDEWVNYGPGVDGWSRRWRGPGRWLGRVLAPVVSALVGIPARLRLDLAGEWSFNSLHTLSVARGAGWRLPDATVDHPGVAAALLAGVPAAPDWGWRLLCCGRIDPRKGIATAVRALALLPDHARLTVHGEGDSGHLSELKTLAHDLGVGDRVCFSSGPPHEVAGVYASCDALLFPVTWHEPWGLVALEAMAAGRPVVAARAGGGAAEYLAPEVNSLGFAPGQAGELAAAVTRLAGDPELRARLVARGRITAGRFTEDAFHAALERRLAVAVRRGPRA